MNPGDMLEGSGQLLQHGRLIATVDYRLTIPSETHFIIIPTGGFRLNYDAYLSGFILLSVDDADQIALTDYTLELATKDRVPIRVERRYKKVEREGAQKISFWVTTVQ